MNTDLLNQIKQQSASLSLIEKQELVDFLARQVQIDKKTETFENDVHLKNVHEKHLNWLKKNREEYAGKYVALSGDQLIGVGNSVREASEQARENGVINPFLVRVYSENETPFAGW